jgi:hypothetical protein
MMLKGPKRLWERSTTLEVEEGEVVLAKRRPPRRERDEGGEPEDVGVRMKR